MSSEDLIHEASNPATTPARLAELASADRATWPAIAGNPAAYDGLLQWLGERDDPAVNAVLTARTQASMPPVPPLAPPAAAPVAPVEAPVETPTVVTPVEPAFTAPAQPDPTAVFQAPSTEPTAVFQTPAAPEPTATYAPVEAATETPATTTEGGGDGKNLAIVIGMVAVVIALIAGAAFGATQVFGDDDDDKNSSLLGNKSSDSDDDKDEIDPPELDSPEDDFPEDPYPENDVPEASGDFCTSMASIQKANEELVSRTGESPDLDELKEMGEDMADAYEDLAETAPSDLQTDIRAMGAYFELMTNPTADSASKMSESISDYAESAQKVSMYYAQNCL